MTLIKTVNQALIDSSNYNLPFALFEDNVLVFLNFFNDELKKHTSIKKYPDLFFLTFWLRKQNIKSIKSQYNLDNRIGLGLLFHITPSNMPTSFFYSFIFGILTGNSNIIRLPSKNFDQVDIILELIEKIFKNSKFKKIKNLTHFVRYEDKYESTKKISAQCNARIIWGGDKAINEIRKIPIPAKSREITFSDRVSFSILNSDKISKLTNKLLENLCNSFYSDAYFIDQNACSSPHLILWYGESYNSARTKFWSKFKKIASKKYDLPEIGALEKFSHFCEDLINSNIKSKKLTDNYTYNVESVNNNFNFENLRSKWGYFYEKKINSIHDLKNYDNLKNQTLTYYGFKKEFLLNYVINNNLLGIDRIVPVGYAHAISTKWDGYDIVYSFSRIVDIY